MKIMLNATCFHPDKPTGIEWFALHIAREICGIDSSALVISSGRMVDVPTAIISKLLSYSRSAFNNHEYLFRTIWDQTWFRHIISKYKPDVLYWPIQDGMFYPPVKQIVTIHDLHYLHFNESIPECRSEINPLRTKLYRHKMPHILKYSSAVVAVSESTKQEIVSSFGINPDKIHVVYNGYDEERFRVINERVGVLQRYGLLEGRYFLFVGSILRHKNLDRLVQAFGKLDRETFLVVAGVCKDVSYFKHVTDTVRNLGIQLDKVRYLDYVTDEDLPYLYNGALAFVLPSLHEGFGVPIVEAMACGVPVITSNCSAMPEVAGDAALFVDPYSVESIANAMREIMDNPQRAEALRSAGLKRAMMFRWSYSAQKLYDVCKMVSES